VLSSVINVFMNKIRLLLAVVSAFSIFVSCEAPPTSISGQSPDYHGEMTVLYENESFVQRGIEVKAQFDEDKGTLDIMLKKVKFVPAMPVRIDVTIMNIPCSENADETFTFAADDLVPWAMGGLYDTYRVDDLVGTISDGELLFEMVFFNTKKNAGYPTTYVGKLQTD